ncbi:MAG: ADP-ribosylglycohydrolase family protein, partial [Tannerella sp.]|nr:ADP-ribosylglycohydrolase family protein [Tannerella sp.]
YDLNRIAQNFVDWRNNAWWTPYGRVFDIGIATDNAIALLNNGATPEFSGGTSEYDNGNGSLMRIMPLLFYLLDKPVDERFEVTRQVSAITHAHIRSVIACFYYLEFARQTIDEKDKFAVYKNLQNEVLNSLTSKNIRPEEISVFDRLLRRDISQLPENEIRSSGYVVDTLEAAVWSFMTSNSYEECVLKAVNLGDDTDTVAAVVGGLAGLYYGFENIPERWINQLARRSDIEGLAERLAVKTDRQ